MMRLAGRFGRGLPLFNELRREFPNLPQSWISRGYQYGREILRAMAIAADTSTSSPGFLKDIPVIPGLTIGANNRGRILYRFRVRSFEKFSRTPRYTIVDVVANKPLASDELMRRAESLARSQLEHYPRRGGGRGAPDIREIDPVLIFVGRRF
jgi:hypothetical protein